MAEHKLIISRINSFENIYMLPVGNLLVVEYMDRPGVLAKITTCCGDAQINIEDIHAPHDVTGKRSLAILYTDKQVPQNLVEKLKQDVDASLALSLSLPN